jgi:hypothetical protein
MHVMHILGGEDVAESINQLNRDDDVIPHKSRNKEAESQQIVAQRLLSCLQYPVPIKSSTEDLTRPTL